MLLVGDCRKVLERLPDNHVNAIVTSPPYYNVRDYGAKKQIGQEATPQAYINELVLVFREARRVLRDDGVMWLNIGDFYKNRQVMGLPWRVAFALQDDGWIIRQDIIWEKPDTQPESVRDRCTKSHEYIFMMCKTHKYWSDMKSVAEPAKWANDRRGIGRYECNGKRKGEAGTGQRSFVAIKATRNKRSVWEVATDEFPGAHFATFPPKLIEPCIKMSCPKGGVVLDPFAGSGTTGVVAALLGREAILIEISQEYADLIRERLGPLWTRANKFNDVTDLSEVA